MSSDLAVSVKNLGKSYQIYDKPRDRLLQMLFRNRRYYREFHALQDLSFELKRGETLGIIGRNGAGKSTLLQLICGTLHPSSGEVKVNGRIAALLELGAGFNPEFTGRENIFLNAAVLGLTAEEIKARYDDIVAFSGIGEFIDQPVKTYSSGMYVRLAFAVATSVEPDILIIDEALSVGDGAFARKSFERIMALKQRGATVLFCTHSMYYVESFCDRAIWLESGKMQMLDISQRVTSAYQATLDSVVGAEVGSQSISLQPDNGRIINCHAEVDGVSGKTLNLKSMQSCLRVTLEFQVNRSLPPPTILLGIANAATITIASVSSLESGIEISRDKEGKGKVSVTFPGLPLLKGDYFITAILACERAMQAYDVAERCITFTVSQQGAAQGFVVLPHSWQVNS